MMSLFGLSEFLMNDRERQAAKARQAASVERRCANPVDWSPTIKWQPQLTIRGEGYPIRSLFDVKPCGPDINLSKPEHRATSPSGAFVYCEKSVPRGALLQTLYGRQVGDVMFDSPVRIPALHERRYGTTYEFLPWMSLTPMELLTLRGGTKRAKGSVVVAGLGLGHQLIEVSQRRQVKKLVLVEHSQELVDWLMPRIRPHLGCDVQILVGDAYKVLPTLKADVALIDIFPDYGSNRFGEHCPHIGAIWCWGAA